MEVNGLIAALADLSKFTVHFICLFLPVVGHGIAMNDKEGRNGRLGCADITADSSLFAEKSLKYKKESDFSR